MSEETKKKSTAKRTAATAPKSRPSKKTTTASKRTSTSKSAPKTAAKSTPNKPSKPVEESVKMHYTTEPSVWKARLTKGRQATFRTLRQRSFWAWVAGSIVAIFLLLIVWWQWQRSYVAVVGGQYLPVSMMDDQLRANYGTNGVNSIIQQQLILQEGKRKNIKITDKQINDELNKIIESSGGKTSYAQQLNQLGIPESLLQYQVKVQLVREQLLKDKTQVSDKEIQDYYDQNKSSIDADGKTGIDALKDQIKETLKQQKLDSETPDYVDSLRQRTHVETNLDHISLTFGKFLEQTVYPIPNQIWDFITGKK